MATINTMKVKRQALHDHLLALLNIHTDFKSNQRWRESVLFASTDVDRRIVMGDPVAYMEVLHIGDDGGVNMGGAGKYHGTAHRFLCSVWLEYEDADTYDQSTQADWDTIIEDPEEGILPSMRLLGNLQTPSGGPFTSSVEVSPPQRVLVDYQMDSHFCTFEVVISNQF